MPHEVAGLCIVMSRPRRRGKGVNEQVGGRREHRRRHALLDFSAGIKASISDQKLCKTLASTQKIPARKMESPSRVLVRQPPTNRPHTVSPEERCRLQLKQEITIIIEPYRTLSEKPPFSAAELIVMAVVCFDGHPAGPTCSEILQYIILSFRHYICKSVQEYADSFRGAYNERRDYGSHFVPCAVDGFWRAFKDYESPLIETTHNEAGKEVERYTVAPAEARLFLRRILEPRRNGFFNFFELPAELRNRIYEYLLLFSGDGDLTIARALGFPSGPCTFLLRQRANESAPLSNDQQTKFHVFGGPLGYYPVNGTVAPPSRSHLAIFSTCRQAHDEAMPLFYGLTHIRFHCLDAIEQYLVKGQRRRVRKLGSVGITLTHPGEYQVLPAAVQKLATIRNLKNLRIGMLGDREWLDMSWGSRWNMGWRLQRKFKKFEEIPGMLELAELAWSIPEFDVQIHVEGHCPGFKTFMAEQLQILSDPQGGTTAEKRARDKKAKAKAAKSSKKAVKSSKKSNLAV